MAFKLKSIFHFYLQFIKKYFQVAGVSNVAGGFSFIIKKSLRSG